MYSYFGICPDGKESLILFEAVRKGIIPTVSDRLSEEERKEIVSGAIYIWDERKSPMRRWTDGRAWSNSRVVGDFLEYRESIPDPTGKSGKYCIKPYGLRKRTICLPEFGDSSLRLIAYFTSNDVKKGILKPPSANPKFADIVREMDEDPSGHRSLQLLASMRKRKRFKSVVLDLKSEKQSHNRPVVTIAPAPSRQSEVVEAQKRQLNSPAGSLGETSSSDMIPKSEDASLHQSPVLTSTDTGEPISPTSSSHEPTKIGDITSQLPSPVWRPHNMHSEDRRALNLLDSHNVVLTDRVKGK